MNKVSLLSLFIFTVSCGPAPSERQFPESPNSSQSELEPTIIVTKASQGALKCQMTSASLPTDQFEWKDLNKTSHMKILKNDKTLFLIKLAEPWEEQGHLTILFRKADRKSLLDGSIHNQNLFKTATLYENVETEIYRVSEAVHCTFFRN